VGALLKRMGEQDIGNIRILQHDAVEVLEHMLDEKAWTACTFFSPTLGTNCVTTNVA